jgi:hypothetical protein
MSMLCTNKCYFWHIFNTISVKKGDSKLKTLVIFLSVSFNTVPPLTRLSLLKQACKWSHVYTLFKMFQNRLNYTNAKNRAFYSSVAANKEKQFVVQHFKSNIVRRTRSRYEFNEFR